MGSNIGVLHGQGIGQSYRVAALSLCFQPRRGEVERRLVPLRDDQSDIFAERRRFEQVLLPEEPLFPFLRGEDVRVIEENVDIEMRREPLETRA